jgi:hypothetical protein
MGTLASLEQSSLALLGDETAAYFSYIQIDDWINAAIADLNNHFPKRTTYDMSTVAGQHEYDLPNNTIAILSVEYPADEDPPEYLLRKAYTDPEFWLSDDYYDYLPSNAATTSYEPRLIISDDPPAGEVMRLELHAEHNPLSDPGDETTILARHEHLIPLFVRWKALQELASTEGYNPDPIKKLVGELELAAKRAEQAYRDSLAAARKAESVSAQTYWRMDNKDRIY